MGKYQNIKLCAPFECSHDYMVILIRWTKYFCKILHGQYGHRNNVWKKDLWLKYRSIKVRTTFWYSHDHQMWIFISQVKYFCKILHSTSQAFYTIQGHLKQSTKQEVMTKNWKASFLEKSFKGCSGLKDFRVIVRIAHGPPDPTSALCGLEPCFLPVTWPNLGSPRNSPNWPDVSNGWVWSKNFTPTIFLASIWHLIRSNCIIC
jgi:hypothetical protein